jgi:diguanylate cyclase (GGDEF)-like protein
MHGPTIRAQLLILALAAIVPVAGAVIYAIVDASRASLAQAEGQVRNLAAITANEVQARLAENEQLLSRLAQRPLVRAVNPRRCDPFLTEFAKINPEYTNLAIRDVQGNSVCSLLAIPPASVAVMFPWFQEGIRSSGFVAGDAILGGASKRWFSALTYPLRDDRGEVIGLLAMGLDLMKLQGRVLPTAPRDVVVSVIDRQGKFLMRSEDPEAWVGTSVRNLDNVKEARRHAEGSYRVTGVDGVPRYFAYRTIAGAGWLVSVGIPEDALLAPFKRKVWIAAAVVAATLLVALVLVRRMAAAIAKPVRDLEAATAKVSAGDLQARAPVGGPAEIANVAREFNRMVESRAAAEARIKNLNRIYAVLSRINSLIVRVRDRSDLFRETCRIAVEAGQFRMAWIGAIDHRTGTIKPITWDGDVRDFLDIAPLELTQTRPGGKALTGRAVSELKAVVSNDVANDPQRVMKKELAERGINSLAIIPLIVGGEAAGVIALYAAETGFFDDEEMKLLGELAEDIAFALDHIEKSEKLDYVAYYDVLTGLANRALFNERLTQRLRIAGREHGLALVLLDIERFKTVNDSLGRPAGDELLRLIARRLAQCAGDAGLVGRLSADHFAVMLDTGHADEVARAVENQVRTCFGAAFRLESGTELRISVRGGIALSPRDGSDFETLHRNAEAALKKAKASGERFVFYAGHMTEKAAEKLTLENKLRLALDRNEFVLHYQPIVDLETRRIEGVEALIRWQSAELGLVPPMEFIPLLEETGMILEAGAWAMRRSALDHRDWVDRGLAAPRISVNVSAIQLRKRDFVQTVRAALAEDAKSPGVDLEITESLVMEDIEENMRKLAAVRDLGVGIAVDDFGTGYSSLRYLALLPVQTVKIDRSFIVTMLNDPSTMTLVSMIIALAHSLRLKVVAEGVDSEQQAVVLRALKCDQMQGYLVSRPLPFADLSAFLESPTPAARAPAP